MGTLDRVKRYGSRAGWSLIGVAAAVGLLSALLHLASWAGLIEQFHVTTWSMRPTIDAGDLIISRPVPASQVKVGDIITIEDDNSTGLTTHRVVEVEPGPTAESRTVTLKGDANEDVDAQPYEITETFVHMVTIPKAGAVKEFLSTPPTQYYVLMMVGALFLLTWLTNPAGEDADDGEPDGEEPQAQDADGARGLRHALRSTWQRFFDDGDEPPTAAPRPVDRMAPQWRPVREEHTAVTDSEPEALDLWRVPDDDPAIRLVPTPFELTR